MGGRLCFIPLHGAVTQVVDHEDELEIAVRVGHLEIPAEFLIHKYVLIQLVPVLVQDLEYKTAAFGIVVHDMEETLAFRGGDIGHRRGVGVVAAASAFVATSGASAVCQADGAESESENSGDNRLVDGKFYCVHTLDFLKFFNSDFLHKTTADIDRKPFFNRNILPLADYKSDQILIRLGKLELPVKSFISEDVLE